jgi:hypothetical protein
MGDSQGVWITDSSKIGRGSIRPIRASLTVSRPLIPNDMRKLASQSQFVET